MKKYPSYIMQSVRQNLALDPNDANNDDEIMNMKKSEIIDRWTTWNNLPGWGDSLIELFNDVYNLDIKKTYEEQL